MDKNKLQTFCKMVSQISEAFGSGDEILYVVDREEKLALEMARALIEKQLADQDLISGSSAARNVPLDDLLANASCRKGGKQSEDLGIWNEMESKSGTREWIIGEGGEGIHSEDIFQCGRKKRYESFKIAEMAAKSYSELKKELFQPYKCSICQSYHIGGDR